MRSIEINENLLAPDVFLRNFGVLILGSLDMQMSITKDEYNLNVDLFVDLLSHYEVIVKMRGPGSSSH